MFLSSHFILYTKKNSMYSRLFPYEEQIIYFLFTEEAYPTVCLFMVSVKVLSDL